MPKTLIADLAENNSQSIVKISDDFNYRLTSTGGVLTIDGTSLAVGNIILFRGQSNQILNIVAEIISITQIGSDYIYTLQIPTEYQYLDEFSNILILNGDTYKGITMNLTTTDDVFTLGVSPIIWDILGLPSTTPSFLEIFGDERDASGLSFVNGLNAPINNNPVGMTFDTGFIGMGIGEGIISLSSNGNDITISASTTNPNFIDMGFEAGDNIYVYDNNFEYTREVIAAVSAQTITLENTAPTVGNDYSAISLIPNKQMSIETLNSKMNSQVDKYFKGFEIILNDAEDPNNIQNITSAYVRIRHCVFANQSIGILSIGPISISKCTLYNNSTTDNLACISCNSFTFTRIEESYLFGSKSTNAALISGIASTSPTQTVTILNNIIQFAQYGINCRSTTIVSVNENIINCNSGYLLYGGSTTFYSPRLYNISDIGMQFTGCSIAVISDAAITEADPSIGIQAINLSSFQFDGAPGNIACTTPFDPPVALTPNASGGNGVGY